MNLQSILFALAAASLAVAAPIPSPSNSTADSAPHATKVGPKCEKRSRNVGTEAIWTVTADTIPKDKRRSICPELWRQLEQFDFSCGVARSSGSYCQPRGLHGEDFKWQLYVPFHCNWGMVEAAWWEATHNEYGALNCHVKETEDLVMIGSANETENLSQAQSPHAHDKQGAA
ncbi:hypothetical protein Cob_v001672 [Colletotrichum orbiculare MAFF 240422]|uniref:Uncharacterized protein n=1 Tax=Colletotrichum orbiculare (strain 104-T / ATCC 96160 / CBS 514.97 / LARS 414 / MAFF 240422) TaxID=1213857 RepID=N4UW39_COLOR|nr:hypothetical protein Cob_v001672 [Colletotrichum orbiculare MAFF 240422]